MDYEEDREQGKTDEKAECTKVHEHFEEVLTRRSASS